MGTLDLECRLSSLALTAQGLKGGFQEWLGGGFGIRNLPPHVYSSRLGLVDDCGFWDGGPRGVPMSRFTCNPVTYSLIVKPPMSGYNPKKCG